MITGGTAEGPGIVPSESVLVAAVEGVLITPPVLVLVPPDTAVAPPTCTASLVLAVVTVELPDVEVGFPLAVPLVVRADGALGDLGVVTDAAGKGFGAFLT